MILLLNVNNTRYCFSQLGLVIIDEQHKFGVAQRAKLWKIKILCHMF